VLRKTGLFPIRENARNGMRREVESVEQAVRLLGFIEVTSIVMLEGANKMREEFSGHTDLLGHVLHASVFTGRFPQQLTRHSTSPTNGHARPSQQD
jgi:HD-like signal output (HDOD) protein